MVLRTSHTSSIVKPRFATPACTAVQMLCMHDAVSAHLSALRAKHVQSEHMRRLQVVLILTQRDFGPMFHAERRAHRTGKVYADDADKDMARFILCFIAIAAGARAFARTAQTLQTIHVPVWCPSTLTLMHRVGNDLASCFCAECSAAWHLQTSFVTIELAHVMVLCTCAHVTRVESFSLLVGVPSHRRTPRVQYGATPQ